MKSLIQIINKLQEVLSVIDDHKIDLPQIVVVGSQSSGKSSVLESLVGKSFLPRGAGIVTRAPLILQMIRYKKSDRESMLKLTKNKDIQEWAQFQHKPDIVFHNFDEVKEEIERQTDVLAGSDRGITRMPIILRVFTERYDLTFVDLPGITKIPVGDQPMDIEKQIQNLILEYVQKQNSIILAVVTANSDLTTSESLKIAKEVDPEGARTITVVTKLDLIDRGTLENTRKLLCGEIIPVKLGIIGVVNRSQEDLDHNKTMEETIRSEQEFLKTNYPEIYQKHGNDVLASSLQTILIMHIKKTLPTLLQSMEKSKYQLEKKLNKLQIPDMNVKFIIDLLNDFNNSYCDTIKGNRDDFPDEEIFGGARIVQIFNESFVNKLDMIYPLKDLDDNKIHKQILNANGVNSSTFINEEALKSINSKQSKSLIPPSLLCVELVYKEMLEIANSIDQSVLDRLKIYPKIKELIRNTLENMLEDVVKNTKKKLKDVIETISSPSCLQEPDLLLKIEKSMKKSEESFVDTFINKRRVQAKRAIRLYFGSDSISMEIEDMFKKDLQFKTDLLNSVKSRQIAMHRLAILCYFNDTRNIVKDYVPKCIQRDLINKVMMDLQSVLTCKFLPYLNDESCEKLLIEEKGIKEERQKTEQCLNAINKALDIVNNIDQSSNKRSAPECFSSLNEPPTIKP